MKEKKLLSKALYIATTLFENKYDRWWTPYILHCIRVMNSLNSNDEELNCIALLHDVIEDCFENKLDGTVYLKENWFTDRIIQWVLWLTHTDIDYMDYIRNLSFNKDCLLVKLADLKDNSDITRLKCLSEKDINRLYKYHIAYTYLQSELDI